MLIQYLTDQAVDNLYSNISNNVQWYCSSGKTIGDLGLSEEQAVATSTIDLPQFPLINLSPGAGDDEKNANDIANIKQVYSTWMGLTPLQARSGHMWAYYCHCVPKYHEYICSRWMDGRFTKSQIESLFFVADNRRNLVRENALSSLWWKGYLTYDPDNAINPFWVLDTLWSTTNIADYLDTLNSYSRLRTKGVVGGIAEYLRMSGTDRLRNNVFRELNRQLNRLAAVTSLDYLDEEEIKDLVFKRIALIARNMSSD